MTEEGKKYILRNVEKKKNSMKYILSAFKVIILTKKNIKQTKSVGVKLI